MKFFTFCKICQVLTILHQLICRGVANFGTRCIFPLAFLSVFDFYLACFHLKLQQLHAICDTGLDMFIAC